MKNSLFLISLCALFLAINPLYSENEWKPLLNGKNLRGWSFDVLIGQPHELYFSTYNGVLYIQGKGKKSAIIQTKRKYSDYELKFEWRWPDEPGNSGCLIHCSGRRYKNVWPKSLEIQLRHENAGNFITIGEQIDVPEAQIPKNLPPKDWKHRLRYNLTDDSENPLKKWNQAHIIVDGSNVTVYINGDLVNKGKNTSATSGKISFQSEGANVEFRNILLKKL